jgi:uncharacterized protein YodC (DUF2158 family)
MQTNSGVEEFKMKPGDIVRLKSDGPQMTVEGIYNGDLTGQFSSPQAKCYWFSDEDLYIRNIPVNMLNLVEESK